MPVKFDPDPSGVLITVSVSHLKSEFEAYLPKNGVVALGDKFPTSWLVYDVHPNGLTLIDSDSSIPLFQSWRSLLRFTALYDGIQRGYLKVI